MKRFLCVAAISVAAVGLSGCLDLSMRGEVYPDGSMTLSSSVGLDKAVVAQLVELQGLPKAKGTGPSSTGDMASFAAICRDGYEPLLETVGPAPKAGKRGKAASAAPATTATPALPKPNGTVSERDGLLICTFKDTYADPVKQYAEMAEKNGLPPAAGQLTLLPGGSGYRIEASLRASDATRNGRKLSEEERQSAAMIVGLIPREMTTAVTIAGIRVENTNGTVSADGTSVTWKIPIHRLFDTRPEAEPIKMTADVYFK